MRLMLMLAILALCLTACGGKCIRDIQYIPCQVPALPAEPMYEQPTWKATGLYCLDEAGARQEAINVTLCRDHARDLRLILQGLKKETP